MEQLILLAIIVVFSIIDSVARTNKKKRQAGMPAPSGGTRPEWERDDAEKRETPKSSEGMIPADIWSEIQGLAGGRAPVREAPPPPPPVPVEVETIPPRPLPSHRVHRSHAAYGTDPSSRARSEQDGLDPLRASLGRDAASARRQLKGHKRHALRQAVILQEVLGPPAAMRGDPHPE